MKYINVVCPCCGEKIKILVSDDAVNSVILDAHIGDLTDILSERGLEFGVTGGGEIEDGK